MSILTWSYNHLPDLINKKEQYSFLNERRYGQHQKQRRDELLKAHGTESVQLQNTEAVTQVCWPRKMVWYFRLPFGSVKALRQGKIQGCSCEGNSRVREKQVRLKRQRNEHEGTWKQSRTTAERNFLSYTNSR